MQKNSGLKMFQIAVFVMILAFPQIVFAESADDLKSEAELGAISTSGNSSTTNFNAGLTVQKETDNWTHKGATKLYHSTGESDSGDNAQKFNANLDEHYKIAEKDYLLLSLSYENDRQSGYKYRYYEVIGYGRHLFKSETMEFLLEAGPGGRHSKPDAGPVEDELILRGAVDFSWKINGSVKFSQSIKSVSGEKGTVTDAITSVKALLVGQVAVGLALEVRNDSKPKEGVEATDTKTSVTLVYGF